MNKYQEALNDIKHNINQAYLLVCYNQATKVGVMLLETSTYNCANQLQDLVNRNLPMKVIENCGLINQIDYDCPYCGETLNHNKQHNFCGECGQAIDWGNDE